MTTTFNGREYTDIYALAAATRAEREAVSFEPRRFPVAAPDGRDWGVKIEGLRERTDPYDGRRLPESWSWVAYPVADPESDPHHSGGYPTADDAEAAARDWFIERDLGSLTPLDVGFDLRATGTPVVVPPCGFARVVLPGRKGQGDATIRGRKWLVTRKLKEYGFKIA